MGCGTMGTALAAAMRPSKIKELLIMMKGGFNEKFLMCLLAARRHFSCPSPSGRAACSGIGQIVLQAKPLRRPCCFQLFQVCVCVCAKFQIVC